MRFPDDTQRHSIIGATGSGKTQAALWHLSHRRYDLIPWVVYNTKTDSSIDTIPLIREIDLDELPTIPGVYVVHPLPGEEDLVESHMWAIWGRGNTGVYVDEGYMVGNNNEAFRALLTQGRSKGIPMMINSQRPVWVDRFVFSESEFVQVFRLQHRKDRQMVEEFVPASLEVRLPQYHSFYYDSGEDKLVVMKPVPTLSIIHATFQRRLAAFYRKRFERKVV